MRRISHARGLCAALEEEQVVAEAVAEQAVVNGDAPAVADPVESLDNAESLETELLEVQDTVEEGAAQEAQIEGAVEVTEALDEYQEALESITKQGGLDRNGAMILQIGLEQLCARVGIESTKMAMPSMESFGGASSRVLATESAVNSIKETGKKVWEAIIAAIQRAGAWLKNFWKTLTDSNHRLKARAEKIKAAAASVSGTAATTEIENGSLASKLHTNGKVEKNFGQDFDTFTKFCEAMSSKVVPGVTGYSKKVVELLPKVVQDQESEDIPFRAGEVKSAYAGISLSAGDEGGEGIESLKSTQLLGGRALLVQLPTADGVDGAIQFARCKTTIGLFKPAVAKATSDKMPVMATNEIGGVAANVLKVSAAVDTLRGLENEFDAFVKALSVGAQQFTKNVDLANDAGNPKAVAMKKKMQAAKAIFSGMVTRVSNLPSNFGSYALNTSKAAMDYCEVSMKAYSK